MKAYRDILEQYRDIKITKNELIKNLPASLKWSEDPVVVLTDNLINILEKYKCGVLDDKYLLEWVNTIWFTDFFSYKDEQSDCIVSIMNELEEIDEVGKELTLIKVEKYLIALRNNVEL